jgi:oxygen-dependent protoporphyrinogen oxidase
MEQPGLLLAGAAYRGVGIPDCIREGEDAAQAAVRYLEETKRLRD